MTDQTIERRLYEAGIVAERTNGAIIIDGYPHPSDYVDARIDDILYVFPRYGPMCYMCLEAHDPGRAGSSLTCHMWRVKRDVSAAFRRALAPLLRRLP